MARLPIILSLTCLDRAAAVASQQPVELFLIPHTHADVGWLETVDALARMNVSRILDGVVANLQNGSSSRRFVWDEMAFLATWWDDAETTDAQRGNFSKFVQEGRIELVDNGWSQHDMGATTLDGMLSNWVEGHQWLKDRGFPMPKIGWSLDPFGMSATQSVLQALLGFDAWFFTRASADEVSARKNSKELEFVWRASSSLGDNESELFAHIFESYYCMPKDYRFEQGPDQGSAPGPPWTDKLRTSLAKDLASMATERSAWFRTPNVLIPWGCDYQYQDAALVYDATDLLIDTINANTDEWGVRARYATPSEYLDALQASGTPFPVKEAGDSFFPYISNNKQGAWTGYFTSRPTLKRTDRLAESSLLAAESLFARHAAAGLDGRDELWRQLELSRRNCGIVAHHDAITGTQCRAQEGCAGGNQVVGSHDVLGDYQYLVETALEATEQASANMLSRVHGGTKLKADPTELGNLLLSGKRGLVVAHNPLAEERVTIIRVPVPICNVDVKEAGSDGKRVLAQVTAELSIPSITAPYYDFEVAFETTLAPLQSKSFVITSAIGGCGGGDFSGLKSTNGGTIFAKHQEVFMSKPAELAPEEVVDREFSSTSSVKTTWREALCSSGSSMASSSTCKLGSAVGSGLNLGDSLGVWQSISNGRMVLTLQDDGNVVLIYRSKYGRPNTTVWETGTSGQKADRFTLEIDDLKLYNGESLVWSSGIGATAADHLLIQGDCNMVLKDRQLAPIWSSKSSPCIDEQPPPVVLENDVLAVYISPTSGMEALYDKRSGTNYSLRHDLVVYDTTQPDGRSKSDAYKFQPNGPATPLVPKGSKVLGATVVQGPVMSEVRLQLSNQHKTFLRIWHSSDMSVSGRLEVANEIGTLEPHQEISSRFTAPEVADSVSDGLIVNEENGYEKLEHVFSDQGFSGNPEFYIPAQYWPSQMSAALRGTASGVQLSVALDRAKGVATLGAGELEVMHHRRVSAFDGYGSAVVLDDTDRIHTELWAAIGITEAANRQREEMKRQMNYPVVLQYSAAPSEEGLFVMQHGSGAISGLPASVGLQTVRATSATGNELIVRLQHRYAAGEDDELSAAVDVDVAKLVLDMVLGQPAGVAIDSITETTLNAWMPKDQLHRRSFATVDKDIESRPRHQLPAAAGTTVTINAFELRTFIVKLSGGTFDTGIATFV